MNKKIKILNQKKSKKKRKRPLYIYLIKYIYYIK